MRRVVSVLLTVVAILLGVLGALRNVETATAQPTPTQMAPTTIFEFFAADTGVQCEMGRADHDWVHRDYAYCQTESTRRSVSFSAGRPAKKCGPSMGCLGNPGIGTPTLRVGVVVGSGSLTCAVTAHDVACRDAVGYGFVMSRTTTTALTP